MAAVAEAVAMAAEDMEVAAMAADGVAVDTAVAADMVNAY